MNFNTYASWKEGAKALGAVKFVGSKYSANAFDENMHSIGSWMGDVGYGYPIKKRRAPKAIVRKSQAESEYVFGGSGLGFEPVKKVTSKSKTGFKTVQNPVKPRKGESERKFVSRCMSEEKESFPKQKQRIAVCLSKARKNPLLESGSTISRNSGINRRAASMT